MLVKSKSGKIYNPKRAITFSNRMIKALTMELENSHELDYIEFLEKEIHRHKSFKQVSENKLYILNK
jgi:hypothetical protein